MEDQAAAAAADPADTEDGKGDKDADGVKKEKPNKKKKKKTIKVTKTKTVTERKKAVLDVVSHFTVCLCVTPFFVALAFFIPLSYVFCYVRQLFSVSAF